MSYEFHKEIIENVARELRPSIYIELGVWHADTFNSVAKHATRAYAVDSNKDLGDWVGKREGWSHHIMTTNEFAAIYNQAPIDLIFIDADHSKEAVYKDVCNFYPYLTTDRGIMILHDTWPPSERHTLPGYCGDGYLVKKKLKAEFPEMEMATLPCQYGLTIIRKPGLDWRNG